MAFGICHSFLFWFSFFVSDNFSFFFDLDSCFDFFDEFSVRLFDFFFDLSFENSQMSTRSPGPGLGPGPGQRLHRLKSLTRVTRPLFGTVKYLKAFLSWIIGNIFTLFVQFLKLLKFFFEIFGRFRCRFWRLRRFQSLVINGDFNIVTVQLRQSFFCSC